jgi:hypothetical protein
MTQGDQERVGSGSVAYGHAQVVRVQAWEGVAAADGEAGFAEA